MPRNLAARRKNPRAEYLDTPLLADTPEDAVRQALYTINQESPDHPADAMHVHRVDDLEYDVKFPDALDAAVGSGSPAIRISDVTYSTVYQEHTATIDLYGPDGQLDFRWYARVPALPTVYAFATRPGSEDAQTPAEFTLVRTGQTGGSLTAGYTLGGTATPGIFAATPPPLTYTIPDTDPHNADYILPSTSLAGPFTATFQPGDDSIAIPLTATNDAYDEIGGETITLAIADDPRTAQGLPPLYAAAQPATQPAANPVKNLTIQLHQPRDHDKMTKEEWTNVHNWLEAFPAQKEELQRAAQLYPNLLGYYHHYAALLRAFGDAVDMLKADEIDRWADGLVPKVDQMTFERVEHPTATGPAIAIKVTSKRDAPAGLPPNSKRRLRIQPNAVDYFDVFWIGPGIVTEQKRTLYAEPDVKEYIAIVVPKKASDLPDGRTKDGYFPSFAVLESFGTYQDDTFEFSPEIEDRRAQTHFIIREN